MANKNVTVPKTPTLDKMLKVKNESQAIGRFLDWLIYDKKYSICEYERNTLYPIFESIDILLHEYFDIDPVKEEQERESILDYIRKGGHYE